MIIKVFNRNIKLPKLGQLHSEMYNILGFNIELMASCIKVGSIDAVSLRIVVNESLMSSSDFTKEFLNNSHKVDLILLNGVFNNKMSGYILDNIK